MPGVRGTLRGRRVGHEAPTARPAAGRRHWRAASTTRAASLLAAQQRVLALADDADLRGRSCARRSRPTRRASFHRPTPRRGPVQRDARRHLQGVRGRAEGDARPAGTHDADMEAASFALAGALGQDTVDELGTTLSDTTAEDAAVCAPRATSSGASSTSRNHTGRHSCATWLSRACNRHRKETLAKKSLRC